MYSFRIVGVPPKYKQIGENSDVKQNKGSGDLRARPHPAKLPTREKKIEKNKKEF